MKDNGIWMLRKVVLYKATIITYSKLNTDKLNEEEIFLAAPQETGQDTRGEVLEQAARNVFRQTGTRIGNVDTQSVRARDGVDPDPSDA